MKKILLGIFCAAFFGACAFFTVGMMIPGASGATEGASAPALISDGEINSGYGDEFEAYFSKSFAFRSKVVSTFSALREKVFKTGNDQVTVGRDGFLFFNEALDDYTGECAMTDDQIRAAADSLSAMARYCDERGVRFVFVCAPSKASVYGEMLPDRVKATDVSDLDRLYGALDTRDVTYVDLRAPLESAKGDALLYHKRDSHWNGRGASVAYGEIMRALGRDSVDFGAFSPRDDFEGDLDRLLYPGEVKYDNDEVQNFEGMYIFTSAYASPMDMTIKTRSGGSGKLLMFRDSFANALISYMSSTFSEVQFERANPYRFELLATFRADTVIVEIAERNLRDLIGAFAQ